MKVHFLSAHGWFATSRGALIALFALFTLLRAAAILLDVAPSSDAAWYYSRADMLAQGFKAHIFYVNPVYEDPAFLRIIKTGD